jgi:CHAT domain-containing protein/tetratricopeptide (TPR) repeat protein
MVQSESAQSSLPELLANVRSTKLLKAGSTQEFKIHLRSGQYFELQVQQLGIDVAVSLVRSDGAQAVEMDGPEGDHGREFLRFLVDRDDEYTVRIVSTVPDQPDGKYEIRLAEMRDPDSQDLIRVKANAVYREAIRLFFERKPESIRKAIPLFESVLPQWKETHDVYLYGTAASVLGAAYFQLGEREGARKYLTESLDPLKEAGNLVAYATSRNYLGGMSQNEGDIQGALQQYYEALGVFRQLSNGVGKASALNNVGLMFFLLGEQERALQYFLEDLPILREIKLPRGEVLVLSNLGRIYSAIGEYDKAETVLQQALAMRGNATDMRGDARILMEMGNVLAKKNDLEAAWKYLTEALETFRKAEDYSGQGAALGALGRIRSLEGNYPAAEELQKQSQEIFDSHEDRPGSLGALTLLAEALRDRDHLEEARETSQAALHLAERLRSLVVSPDLRANYLGSLQRAYEIDIDIAMQMASKQKDPTLVAAALETSEQARARTLLESLPELRTDLRRGMDPDLLRRERELTGQIRKVAAQGTARSSKQAELDQLFLQLELLQGEMRRKNPGYASLAHSDPLSAERMQALLDEGTQLIEFSLGEDRSWAWLITPTEARPGESRKPARIDPVELPKRSVIEPVVKELYRKLSMPITGDEPPKGIEEDARKVSDLLLSKFSGKLRSKTTLLIVPSGVLAYVPFAALPEPGSSHTRLLANHEIVVVPSLSALAAMRLETRKRRPAPKTIAVLADPVFQPSDRRLGNLANRTANPQQRSSESDVSDIGRAATDIGLFNPGAITRLSSTADEANLIRKLVSPTQSLVAVDFDATRALAMSPRLRQYRILHFATHGFADSLHPNLSGIVLSLVDRQGRKVDGFLRVLDVYNMDLAADLVVLSACKTALGRNVSGEGVLGLTRGFMYAGAPRVLSTLWEVNDRAAAILMTRFYENMLGQKMLPSAALRAAQLSMASEKRWNSPVFWAAFSLHGEWR